MLNGSNSQKLEFIDSDLVVGSGEQDMFYELLMGDETETGISTSSESWAAYIGGEKM